MSNNIGEVTADAISELEEWAGECSEIVGYATIEEDRESYTSRQDQIKDTIEALRAAPVTLDKADNDYLWDGEPFWLRVGNAVIHIKLSDLSARLYVDTYRAGEEADDPMDTALLALPGGPETGEED